MHAADSLPVLDVRLRPADLDDAPLIEAWIKTWSDRQVLLSLAGDALRVALPDFRVLSPAFGPPTVLAFGALRRYSPRLAEIRSLVVADGLHRRGLGHFLVGGLLDEARLEGLRRVFVLTRAPAVFERCDELALVRDLP